MSERQVVALVVGIIGIGLVWYGTSWIVALGLFLALFGNNISKDI